MKDTTKQFLSHIQISSKSAQEPSISLLNQIHYRTLIHVPFENLWIHQNRALSLETTDIFKKVVEQGYGGLCFETNSLLEDLLLDLGYTCHLLSAQFWNEETQDWDPEFGHMGISVTMEDGPYLFDVGLGSSFYEPLIIQTDKELIDRGGNVFQFVHPINEPEVYELHKKNDQKWNPLIRFTLIPRSRDQFQGMCHYHQTDQRSIFPRSKIISRLTEDGKVTLLEKELRVTVKEELTKQMISTPNEWREALEKWFGISWDQQVN